MMSDKRTARIQALKEGMQRLNRLLEAENASFQCIMKTDAQNQSGNISSGLCTLLSGGVTIAPRATASYEDFAPGVWVATEERDGANRIVVEYEPASRGNMEGDDHAACAARLGIHPVVTSADSPRWVTLETVVDHTALTSETKLRFDIVADFHFPETRQAMHINTAKLILRCLKNDGTFDDIELGNVPVTTVPMLHRLSNPNLSIDAATLGNCERVVLIFFLPNHGLYTFNLYGFSVEAE